MRIVVCGSMTASVEMVELKSKLESFGHSVILPDFAEEYASLASEKEIKSESAHNKIEHDLIRSYYKKIEESDAILILNPERRGIEGYIGGNTFLELGFAHVLTKKKFVMNKLPTVSYSDEIEAMQPVVINGDLSKIQ